MTLVSSPASAVESTVSLSEGYNHACAVTTDGEAYCWGRNDFGQLGMGTYDDNVTSPVLVGGGLTWASISAGNASTCGVTTDGDGYCWGRGTSGQIGDGSSSHALSPVLVAGSHEWASISTGGFSACGVTTAGAGYCWGANNDGQLGDNTTTDHSTPAIVSGGLTFASIDVPSSNWNFYACGLTTVGSGYCWGGNSDGKLGNGTGSASLVPSAISGGHTWISLSTGKNVACGVKDTGAGYCWGLGTNGELGNGGTSNRNTPTAMTGGLSFSSISSGDGVSCGVTTSNAGYCWGLNALGALGTGNNTDSTVPVAVTGGHSFDRLTVGDGGACGLTLVASVLCWGWNQYGTLGDGTYTNRNAPVGVLILTSESKNTTVAVIVDPSLTFTVTGRATVCNGQSATNFQTGSTGTAVDLGHVNAATVAGGAQDLSVNTNAANGFTVYLRTSGTTPHSLRSGSNSIADVSGTRASPGAAPSAGTAGFGYTSSDTSTAFTSDTWAKLTNTNDSVLIGGAGTTSKSRCVGYEAAISGSTVAGSYSTTVVYTAIANF